MASIHDRELLEALEKIGGASGTHHVWRVAWKSRHVLDSGGNGRWNTRELDALYTSNEPDGAIAEIYHHLSKAPVFSTAEKLLYRIRVRTINTLYLDTEHALAQCNLALSTLKGRDLALTQAIGAAAFMLDYDSLVVPSVRWNCSNLIIFQDRIGADRIEVEEPKPINFPAWREKHQKTFARIRLSTPSNQVQS